MYIVIAQQKTESGYQVLPTYAYNTLNEAESAFHTQLASAMITPTVLEYTCTVLDHMGNVMMNRAYFADNVEA